MPWDKITKKLSFSKVKKLLRRRDIFKGQKWTKKLTEKFCFKQKSYPGHLLTGCPKKSGISGSDDSGHLQGQKL